ncbi:helix-turn-helix domain-containing protein [Thermomonospora umbrina]|uniref:Helix-turn-helix protein n=1 Tax=Thermomonospora umbrina TaxID=111806 RepID=A0A3D9T7M5_9ACTN|nr:helix-turn-helix transcriptional regulator [Thermomonospora umbrina]REF00675.1 helix-turn-helix protein [Thermomonospora umbrina]
MVNGNGSNRRSLERQAAEIRLDGLRRGLTTEAVVESIIRRIPEVAALEAWRLANGWSREEVSARLDQLYVADGLEPPNVDSSTLCRWELGHRRPNEERIEYFCRLYRTRPDRLGFGTDHGEANPTHLQRVGIIGAFPYTNEESEEDLTDRIRGARERVNLFGLTRSFYAREEFLPVLEEAAQRVPVRVYVMDPYCDSRRDRYRIEPAEAAMEDPARYIREILRPLRAAAERAPGIRLYSYNFPCSFAMEEVDDVTRIMLYGHGKRGTHGPVLLFQDGGAAHTFVVDQLRWLERMTQGETPEPWMSKGIEVKPLEVA